MDGSALGGMICGLVFGLLIGTVVGAVILRAAISLYNKMAGGAGSPSSVPEPQFGKAMGIVAVTCIVNMMVGFVIGLVVGGAAGGAGTAGAGGADAAKGAQLIAQSIAIPASLLVMAGMLSALLPTTFGRALLVTLCQLLVCLLIVAALGIVFFGVSLAFR